MLTEGCEILDSACKPGRPFISQEVKSWTLRTGGICSPLQSLQREEPSYLWKVCSWLYTLPCSPAILSKWIQADFDILGCFCDAVAWTEEVAQESGYTKYWTWLHAVNPEIPSTLPSEISFPAFTSFSQIWIVLIIVHLYTDTTGIVVLGEGPQCELLQICNL